MDIRKIILARLDRLGWSNYKLVQECKGQVPAATIYEFLASKSNIGSHHLAKVLEVLDLRIVAKRSD